MIRAAWWVVAAVTALRAFAAFALPLTGDEAYYWEWSRHLAFGYADHPPAVAWVIAAFSWPARSPGFVRLGFLACGLVATAALAGAATRLARDGRAGAVAALTFSLAPLCSVAFATASPDGPYLAFWCLTLWLAALAFEQPTRLNYGLLGAAIGGALLARMFGLALLAGIAVASVREPALRRRVGLMTAVALACFLPFVAWNAAHGWATFAFSFVKRHAGDGFSPLRIATLGLACAAAYSPGIAVAVAAALRRSRPPVLLLTALPLLALLAVVAAFERVEVYWALGPFASLCACAGLAYVVATRRARAAWATAATLPAAILLPLLFAAAIVPGPAYHALADHSKIVLRNSGPFEIFAYRPLAFDVEKLARERGAVVMTDGYGFSSVLDFNAGIPPVLIGYDWQGREARNWYPSTMRPQRALFVDKEPFAERPDFQRRLARACRRVHPGPTLRYGYGGTPPRSFYLTWCDALASGGLRILRWESEG